VFPKIAEFAAQESPQEMAKFRDRISEFSIFLTKCQQSNMTNREAMMNSVKNHALQNQHNQDFLSLLTQYEQSAIDYFSQSDLSKRTLTKSDETKPAPFTFKNPF
jgi:predicted XRE-type DNA-binding protein